MDHTPIPAPGVPQTLPPADKEGHHYPFGYKYPDQVAVDYVVLDRTAIAALVTAKDDAAQKLKDMTEAFDNDFSKYPEKYKDKKWDDVKDSLIKAQVDLRVSRRMKLMSNAFVDRASRAAATGPVDYAALAKDLAKTSEFMGYEPPVKHIPLMGAEDLAKVEGIGGSSYHMESRGTDFYFPRLAVSVPELVKLGDNDPIRLMGPKIGAEGPLLTDAAMNNYIYRVTQAVPTHEPQSVDENSIRKQVVEDYKKLESFKKDAERMKALVKAAEAGTLDALAAQEKLSISKPPEVTQLNSIDYQALTRPEVVAANDPKMIAAEMTMKGLDPLKEMLSIPDFTATAFALASRPASAPAGKPAGGLESEGTLRCYVIQVQQVTPVAGKDFADNRRQLIFSPQEDAITFVRDYLKKSALEARLQWKPK